MAEKRQNANNHHSEHKSDVKEVNSDKGENSKVSLNRKDNNNRTSKEVGPRVTRVRSSVSWAEFPPNVEDHSKDTKKLIEKKAAAVRAGEPVNWLPYMEAGLISHSHYSFITSFQAAKSKKERDWILTNFKGEGFKALLTVAQRLCVIEEIQKFLVMVDDMLWEDMSRIKSFNPSETEPWKMFLNHLSSADEFVRNIASRIITKFLRMDFCKPKSPDLHFYLAWLKNELQKDNKYLLNVSRCLQKLLQIDEYRIIFFNINGIFRISRLLDIVNKPQEQYQLVFCIWVSSFNAEVAEKMSRFNIIPILVDILESAPTEILKLPRVIMATFRNMLLKPQDEGVRKHNALLLIQCKIFRCLEFIKTRSRTITDPEFREDLEVIEDRLTNCVAKLSTFEEYQLEVKSGRLEWSVVHTSKPFWEECAERLNDNDYELLKILVDLLAASKDTVVLCVAAHDLGEYMSHYPRGKKVVEKHGGKNALLELLGHKHPVVKYHALKSLQILMLNNFDLLSEYVSEEKIMDVTNPWTNEEAKVH